MLRRFMLIIGLALLLVGISGFVPGVTTAGPNGHQMLFGVFMVGAFHNVFHLISGMIGLFASTSEKYARGYGWMFGLVYAVLAVVGFAIGIGGVNMADNILHTALAFILLSAVLRPASEDKQSLPPQLVR